MIKPMMKPGITGFKKALQGRRQRGNNTDEKIAVLG